MTISPMTTEPRPTPVTTPANGMISSDFDTFLKMLTVQMQNQDPLNPIESTDYAVQLATFSGVEQQVRTNDLLTGLAAQFGLLGMAQLSGWVGQEARVTAPVHMAGMPVTILPDPATAADRAVLVVKDTAGRTVAREDVQVSDAPYQWLGADATGDPLPAGTYALTLESYKGEEFLSSSDVESWARITEVRGGTAGTTLVLAGGVTVEATKVTALRAP
ncbi:MAG: flagellar hook capping FlgD N-terminal domain-containing protein [Pseudomonadota bacterium]